MSVAVGLSFTGCGNSSNGGSTGSSFEPVPLISDGYHTVTCEGSVTCSGSTSNANATEFTLQLYTTKDESYFAVSGSGTTNFESYDDGTWEATQLTDNTYQIEIKDLKPKYPDTGTCTMTCNGLLKLTIPENALEAYRRGEKITGATLEGSFTHKAPNDGSCNLGESSGTTSTFTITLTSIWQS